MTRTASSTTEAPPPPGPFSQCVRTGPMVFCAGQSGHTVEGEIAESIEAQTEQCLRNVLAVLASSGAVETDIVRVGVFLTDVAHFAAMNEVYARTFSQPYPVRTTVYVGLPPGMLIEVDAVAVLEEPTG